MFKVGDVVVCVDDRINPSWPEDNQLKRGKVYRVTKVGKAVVNHLIDKVSGSVHLAGINSSSPHGFGSFRFKHLPKADDTFINQIRSLKPAKENAS